MEVTLGKERVKKTYQAEFPEETECCRCKGVARIGFVVREERDLRTREASDPPLGPQAFVFQLHQNEGKDGYWLHDLCAVAVYFCKECLETTALYNQA